MVGRGLRSAPQRSAELTALTSEATTKVGLYPQGRGQAQVLHLNQRLGVKPLHLGSMPLKSRTNHSGPTIMYPAERTVRINRGSFASSPSFFRSAEMCTSIERSNTS